MVQDLRSATRFGQNLPSAERYFMFCVAAFLRSQSTKMQQHEDEKYHAAAGKKRIFGYPLGDAQ
jgi:hypothetical protein